MNKNLFATVLTYPAPSANYRGESEENRTVIQKITDGRFEYAVISPESMRNALREMLSGYGFPSNRKRLEPTTGTGKKKEEEGGEEKSGEEKQQLAVKFTKYPSPEEYIDDFFFGYLLAIKGKELEKCRNAKGSSYPLKRDSILRMNLARALAPYRHDSLFTQSPQIKDSPWKPGGGDGRANSALLHRETAVTAFQYPIAFNLLDVFGEKTQGPNDETRKKWFAKMLQAISELTDVAGNHARSLYFMAPSSIVIRLTTRLVPGYNTYGFTIGDKGEVSLPEVIDGIEKDDFPGSEFYIGGTIVKQMGEDAEKKLKDKGAKTFRMADQALAAASKDVTGIDFLAPEK